MTKKRDDEITVTVVVCGIFSLALLIILLTAGNIGVMGFSLRLLAYGFTGLTALAWIILLKNFNDPNYDYWRKICIGAAIAAIIVIMGHRVGWLERLQVQKDTEQNKQTGQLITGGDVRITFVQIDSLPFVIYKKRVDTIPH